MRWPGGIVAPRDDEAGGTWLGVNDAGVFAAVTNRYGHAPDKTRRSRGEIVPLVLGAETAREGAVLATTWPVGRFNPFHLVVVDRREAMVVRRVDDSFVMTPLPPGVHVVTERSFMASLSGRELALHERVAQWGGGEPPADAEVRGLLGHHGSPAFDGVCVHMPALEYGTRSSSIIRFRADGSTSWSTANGAPCVSPFESLDTRLLSVAG